MNNDLYIRIATLILAEANEEDLRELREILRGRERTLQAEQVRLYRPGQLIRYMAKDGQTERVGRIDHLNRFSISIRSPDDQRGYTTQVIHISRVLGPMREPPQEFDSPAGPYSQEKP